MIIRIFNSILRRLGYRVVHIEFEGTTSFPLKAEGRPMSYVWDPGQGAFIATSNPTITLTIMDSMDFNGSE